RRVSCARILKRACASGAEAIAVRLTRAELVLARRVGEHDALYGSVTAADIAGELEAQGFEIDKRKIQLAEPIKQLGEHSVPVKLHREVVAHVAVKVTRLEEAAEE
ncbi:MAG TPA: 50S ribosomal protein L9, partial [Vicinamibacterales bacterium]|nr:50S ribosomal protein L9 [Vicinamibacterales bacterium]